MHAIVAACAGQGRRDDASSGVATRPQPAASTTAAQSTRQDAATGQNTSQENYIVQVTTQPSRRAELIADLRALGAAPMTEGMVRFVSDHEVRTEALLGSTSAVEQLRARGYTVTVLEDPASYEEWSRQIQESMPDIDGADAGP